MEFYKEFTRKRPNESSDEYIRRDTAAKKAKAQWDQSFLIEKELGLPLPPEPDWNDWNPEPSINTLSPSMPLEEAQLPQWMRFRLPDDKPWEPPRLAAPLPPGVSPLFDLASQPESLFDDAAPAQPVVVYGGGRVEKLGLRGKDIVRGLQRGAEFVKENGRWVLKQGGRVLGPIGWLGTAKDMYDFYQWADKKGVFSNTSTSDPKLPSTKFDLNNNRVLYLHPGNVYRDYRPKRL